MGKLGESAAYITYLLAIGKKLTYADVEKVARRDYVDPQKLLEEVLALAKESGIASRALKLAGGAPKGVAVARESLEAAEAEETANRRRELIKKMKRTGVGKERLRRRYVSLLSSLYRAGVTDAEKTADAIFAGVGSSELKERALLLSRAPLLAKDATPPAIMMREEKRRRKVAWAESILHQKSMPVAEAPKEKKVEAPRTVVPAKSVPPAKKPADDTLFFHRKEQEDFAREHGYKSWEEYLADKGKGLLRKTRAFQGNKFLRRRRA